MSDLKARLEHVRSRIAEAALRSLRDPASITLVAVSKTHPAEALLEAIDAGITTFGENKVQEAAEKIKTVGRRARWHLIGHLQSNKARRAAAIFDCIQTVDSAELAARLDRICTEISRQRLDVQIQVDLAGEASKSGIEPSRVTDLAEFMTRLERIRLTGLMTIPPFFEDPQSVRPFFRRLREIRDKLAEKSLFADGLTGELSMGMSHDFEVAIEEGATIVRIGTAIFGERAYPVKNLPPDGSL